MQSDGKYTRGRRWVAQKECIPTYLTPPSPVIIERWEQNPKADIGTVVAFGGQANEIRPDVSKAFSRMVVTPSMPVIDFKPLHDANALRGTTVTSAGTWKV